MSELENENAAATLPFVVQNVLHTIYNTMYIVIYIEKYAIFVRITKKEG